MITPIPELAILLVEDEPPATQEGSTEAPQPAEAPQPTEPSQPTADGNEVAPPNTVKLGDYLYSMESLIESYKERFNNVESLIDAGIQRNLDLSRIVELLSANSQLRVSLVQSLKSSTGIGREATQALVEAISNNSPAADALHDWIKVRLEREIAAAVRSQLAASIERIKVDIRSEISTDLKQRAAEAEVLCNSVRGLLSTVFRDELQTLKNDLTREVSAEVSSAAENLQRNLQTRALQLQIIERRLQHVAPETAAALQDIDTVPWDGMTLTPPSTPEARDNAAYLQDHIRRHINLPDRQTSPTASCGFATPGAWRIGNALPSDRDDWDQIYVWLGNAQQRTVVPLWSILVPGHTTTQYYRYSRKDWKSWLRRLMSLHPDAPLEYLYAPFLVPNIFQNRTHMTFTTPPTPWGKMYAAAGFSGNADKWTLVDLDGVEHQLTNELYVRLFHDNPEPTGKTVDTVLRAFWLHFNTVEMRLRHGLIQAPA